MSTHVCIVCPVYAPDRDPSTVERPLVCEGCRSRLRNHLTAIPDLFARLPEALAPGSTPGASRVSGTVERPLGVRVGTLDLIHPGPVTAAGRAAGAVADPYGDQTGHLPVAVVLDQWVRDWRDTRARGEHLPVPTVPALVAWLEVRLDWASSHHPVVDEFAGEIRALVGTLRATLGEGVGRPELCDGVPCKRCDMMSVYRVPGRDYECGACGDIMRPAEYADWTGLLAAAQKEAS